MFINLNSYNRYKPRKKSKKKPAEVYEKYKPGPFRDFSPTESFKRNTVEYPSVVSNSTAVCAKPERKEYTGTLIKGIATMHKSNAVPIINDEEAKDIARMRRG